MRMHKLAENAVHGLTAKTIWNRTSQTSAIKQWANDLTRIASSKFSLEDSMLAGRAVLLQNDDLDLMEEYVRFIATQVGLHLCVVKNDNITAIHEWIKSIAKDKLTLVYLEPGAWMSKDLIEDDDAEWPVVPDFDEGKAATFRKNLTEMLVNQGKNYRFIFVTSIQSVDQMDVSLRKAGLFDRRIIISELDYETEASIFIERVGASRLDNEITADLKRLGCLIHHEFPRTRQRELFCQAVMRLSWQRKDKVTFQDLVQFAAYGICEADFSVDIPEQRYRHSVHEAGHAVVVHLDSRNKLPPEYCSVTKRGNSLGIVVRRYEDYERISNDLSYCDVLHKIRVSLAGRAAEYLLLGANEISANGASGDLENAFTLSTHLFGRQGHSPDLTTDFSIGSNLAPIIGRPSPSEYRHIENLSRKFLNTQFQLVLEMLRANQTYLESIANTLNQRIILLRNDFMTIYKAELP